MRGRLTPQRESRRLSTAFNGMYKVIEHARYMFCLRRNGSVFQLVSQVTTKDEIIAQLLQRGLSYIVEVRSISLTTTLESFCNIRRNRHCGSPHLGDQTKFLL